MSESSLLNKENIAKHIALLHPRLFERAKVTERERKILHWIAVTEKRIDSRDLHKAYPEIFPARTITVQGASITLKKLYDKGYLLREETTSYSGGVVHRYEVWWEIRDAAKSLRFKL